MSEYNLGSEDSSWGKVVSNEDGMSAIFPTEKGQTTIVASKDGYSILDLESGKLTMNNVTFSK